MTGTSSNEPPPPQEHLVGDEADWIKTCTAKISNAIGGGSELFTRHGETFRLDIDFICKRISEMRERQHNAMHRAIKAERALIMPGTPDDVAVDEFAAAMKLKLAEKREQGFGGWDDPTQCHIDYLIKLLIEQINERPVLDPVDIANLSMMIHQRGETPSHGR